MSEWQQWLIGFGIAITLIFVIDLLGAIHTILKSQATILEIEAKRRKEEARRQEFTSKGIR